MKKLFFFAATLLVAGSMMADVTINLSSGESWAQEGVTSNVSVESNVCTSTLTISTAYSAGGVEFVLQDAVAASTISSITGNIKCDATTEYMELYVYVRDTNGHRWYSGSYAAPYQLSNWTAINETPSETMFDDQLASEYPNQSIERVGIIISPGVAVTNYAFSVKDLKLVTTSTGMKEVKATALVTKKMIDGKMVIMRDGKAYNILGF